MMSFGLRSLSLLRPSQPQGVQAARGRIELALGTTLSYVITLYRVSLSPFLPPTCRFSPSCSEYALQAFTRHKLLKAMQLICWRLLRCHPFHPGGHDPL